MCVGRRGVCRWLCRNELPTLTIVSKDFQTNTSSGKERSVRATKMAHSGLQEASRASHRGVGERRAEALVEASR